MKVNLQPMLNEMKQILGNPFASQPELVKVYKTYGYNDANNAITQHWKNVQEGLTSEYVQL